MSYKAIKIKTEELHDYLGEFDVCKAEELLIKYKLEGWRFVYLIPDRDDRFYILFFEKDLIIEIDKMED